MTEPDPRSGLFGVTLEKLHQSAAAAVLNERVPAEIVNHFATAQNLLVYAYYYYPFHMAAQLQAYASLEFALRLRLKPVTRAEKNFRRMFRKAVQEKLVRDRRFTLFQPPHTRIWPEIMKQPDPVVTGSYVEALAGSLPDSRNDLAHGSTALWNGGGGTLLICADLINQLFD